MPSLGRFLKTFSSHEDAMTVNDDARGVNTEDVSASVLSTLKAGLGLLGKHPLRQAHTYLSLSVPRSGLDDASVGSLSSYPNIMYLDVSGNKIGDLSVLGQLPTLVQLDASWNEVGECLAFAPPRCSRTQAWSDGDLAVGSMLTLANLSHNRINALRDLSAHAFLETLLLGYNSIVQIEGLQNLKFLQVLDLSYNKIAAISGLDGLRLQELNLEGNELSSLEGLGGLPSLSVLNVARNKLESLQPLQSCLLQRCCNSSRKALRREQRLSSRWRCSLLGGLWRLSSASPTHRRLQVD